MNQEIKAKWVEALRSGKYEQAKGVMQRGETLCCLGVLREILQPGNRESYANDNKMPTDAVCAAIGLTRHSRANEISAATFSEMNDAGKSFAEIADAIEAAQ